MAEEQSEDIRKTIVKQRSSSGRLDAGLSNYVFGKVPPQARDLEEAVLGAMMLEKDAVAPVFDILKEESFYVESHQLVFKAIKTLFARTEPVDLLTVTEELRRQGNLEKVGGAFAITDLTNRVTSAANVEFHSRIIAQKYIQRELIKISSKIIEDAYEDTTDVLELLDSAEKKIYDVTDKNLRKNYSRIDSLITKARNVLEKLKQHEIDLTGVPSGFTSLDRVTSGWQKNDLIILAARPGMGKTAFVLSLMRNAAVDHKKPVVMFSLEMSNLQLTNRLISAETEIPSEKLRRGSLADHEWAQLTSKIDRLAEAPIFIDDTPAINIFELRAKCRRLKASHDIQMIIIDYLQLMSGNTDNRNSNREQEISNISRALKGLAKELEVPVIALSQLNRSVETRGGDKRPQLSDLRESGAIEQDADMVIFLYRPEYYKFDKTPDNVPVKGMTEVIIAKHRNGQLDTVPVRFIDYLMKFSDMDPRDLQADNSFGGFTENPEGNVNVKTFKSKMDDVNEGGDTPW
jgi:replicative DNA helicase